MIKKTIKILFPGMACFLLSIPVFSQKVAGSNKTVSGYAFLWKNQGQGNLPVFGLSAFNDHHFEQKVLDYINEMRRDPKRFYKQYVKDYIRENESRFTSYYTHSLKNDLYQSPSLPPFKTSSALEKTASRQLRYLIRLGGTTLTHNRGRTSFGDRMREAGLHCFAENLYRAVNPDPLEVVLDLLIDQGVSSLGHRKNMLNPAYTSIGIQNDVASNDYNIIVMDFGCASASLSN
jgi:hypothetical protein